MSAVAEVLRSPDEVRFSSFLKHAPAGFALCQIPGNITATNSVFDQLLGLSSSPIPIPVADLIQPQDGCDSRRLLSELFRGTRESFQVECPVSGDVSKSRRWTVWAVRREGGRPRFAVVMLEDLTDAAATQQRLHQAERLETIGRLADGVAHDFNNLLTGVLLYCDLLLSVVGPSDRARKYAEEIRKAGLRADFRRNRELQNANSPGQRREQLPEYLPALRSFCGRRQRYAHG